MIAKNLIPARANIPIYFSTVTNTSKKIAYLLQESLEAANFLVTVTNIGDFNREEFVEHDGPIVLLLSTYGNGGSPTDGEEFVNWIKQVENNKIFCNIRIAVMGFGNRSFEHFCGNAKKVRELLISKGANEILEIECCNAGSPQQQASQKFVQWSNRLIQKLKEIYPTIRSIDPGDLLQKYNIIVKKEDEIENWYQQYQKWESKLGKQFLTYRKAFTSKVIHIKQLREQNDGRSTLWLRLERPQGLSLNPACNINVYPENIRKKQQQKLKGGFYLQAKNPTSKIPYPPMRNEDLWSISNLNQIADLNIIKMGVMMSLESEEKKQKYRNYLKSPQNIPSNGVRCYEIYQQLNLGIDFLIKIGINTLRSYTLASWEPEKNYFDLVVSIDQKGLTSRYFQSIPKFIKIYPTQSSFYVPVGRPVIMIANGSGIAPFRSLTQYFLALSEPPKLYLYFGIQNRSIDYYFKSQWQKMEKQGRINIKIAESRANPEQKIYVQQLLKDDRQFLKKHIFQNNGVILICGNKGMAKSVDSQIYQSVKLFQPVPFKAFKLHVELIKNKTVVKQVFD